MTSRSDEVARWWLKARVRYHRRVSDAVGVWRFAREALFWSFIAVAGIGILGMLVAMPDWTISFSTQAVGSGSQGVSLLSLVVVLGLLVVCFGLFMAWCSQRIRDNRRELHVRQSQRRERRSSAVEAPDGPET